MSDPRNMTNTRKKCSDSLSDSEKSNAVTQRSCKRMAQVSKQFKEGEPPTEIPTLPEKYRNRNIFLEINTQRPAVRFSGLDEHFFPYRRALRSEHAEKDSSKLTTRGTHPGETNVSKNRRKKRSYVPVKRDQSEKRGSAIIKAGDRSCGDQDDMESSSKCGMATKQSARNIGLRSARTGLRSSPVHKIVGKRMRSDQDALSNRGLKTEVVAQSSKDSPSKREVLAFNRRSIEHYKLSKDNVKEDKMDESASQSSHVIRRCLVHERNCSAPQEDGEQEKPVLNRSVSPTEAAKERGRAFVDPEIVETPIQTKKRKRVSFSPNLTEIFDERGKNGTSTNNETVVYQKLDEDCLDINSLHSCPGVVKKRKLDTCPPAHPGRSQERKDNPCSFQRCTNASTESESSDEPSPIILSPVKRYEDFSDDKDREKYLSERNQKIDILRHRMTIIRGKRRRMFQREQEKKSE